MSSSIAAVTNLSDGKRVVIFAMPSREAIRLTKTMFASLTPASLSNSIALDAEPPVASMGSNMKTTRIVNLKSLHLFFANSLPFDAIVAGNFE